MSGQPKSFLDERNAMMDRVVALLDRQMAESRPRLLGNMGEMAPGEALRAARLECWALLRNGVLHLKEGAPGGAPGSMAEALSRASLRRSALAAALGVKPPQFEQIFLPADFSTGAEAALYFCRRLCDAALGDLSKSRQLLHQKILAKNALSAFALAGAERTQDDLRRQIALSFDALTSAYPDVCKDFRTSLDDLALSPNTPKPPSPCP